MFESADPKQPFYVANQVAVSEENIRVLTTLFEPLVGIQGVGLYITLTKEFDEVPFAKDYKTLYQLQDQTNLKLEDLFSTSKIKVSPKTGFDPIKVLINPVASKGWRVENKSTNFRCVWS